MLNDLRIITDLHRALSEAHDLLAYVSGTLSACGEKDYSLKLDAALIDINMINGRLLARTGTEPTKE
jgi:hypothetical protein